jgi:carboxymethylenebutenolidase
MLMFDINQSQLSFESGGQQVRLDCYAPSANGQRFPAVIGLHGSGGGYPVVAVPARMLAAQGFAVYVVHYFDRTGTEWVSDKATILRHAPAWMKTVWDSISFVSRQPHVDAERIGLLGFSLGAYLSLGIASIDNRVKAVVDFFGGFPREMKLFMRRFCPVLILHGDADAMVPVFEAHQVAEIAERKQVPYEMKIYPGVGHGFGPETMRDAAQRTLLFLQRHLVPRAVDI